MDGTRENRTDGRRRERIIERLDQMVVAGRVTNQEAKRLRTAGMPGEFDDGILDIRVRHAGTILDAAVQDGRLTQEEADSFLERLRNGEHPRSLRAYLRSVRTGDRSRVGVPGLARPDDDPQQDSPA
jgi:polyhydroxyalkanoate synthesis regulator phasin